jgi:hypothetical protein
MYTTWPLWMAAMSLSMASRMSCCSSSGIERKGRNVTPGIVNAWRSENGTVPGEDNHKKKWELATRFHVKEIYGKLGVNRQAQVMAREAGLL